MRGQGEDEMMAYIRRRLGEVERSAVVELSFHPNRTDAYNKSPDFIVDVTITLPFFQSEVPLRIKIPLLVEVEAAAGFNAGLEDLDRFVTRVNAGVDPTGPPIELPFPIATAEAGNKERELVCQLPIRFRAREVGIPKRDSQ